jgi:hypothetical protein
MEQRRRNQRDHCSPLGARATRPQHLNAASMEACRWKNGGLPRDIFDWILWLKKPLLWHNQDMSNLRFFTAR